MCTHLSENACGDFGITVAAITKGEEHGTTFHTIAQFFFSSIICETNSSS